MRYLTILLVLTTSMFAQIGDGGKSGMGGTAGMGTGSNIPQAFSWRGMPSTETNAVGTKTFNTCATDSYCTQLVDPTLPGNGIIVFYEYKAASGNTANVPTVFDCKTTGCTTAADTFTHCGTEANNSTNDWYMGCYYTLNATTGSRNITVQWTAAVTQVAVAVAELVNVTSLDVYATNSGTGATTFTSGSATSTANGDLWFEFGQGTSTIKNVGVYAPGSQAGIVWKAEMADQQDAAFIQEGIQTTAGALNPQFTSTTSNNYVALGVAFKAGVAGTAPSGMYIQKMYTVSTTPSTPAGVYNFQFPVEGNLAANLTTGFVQYLAAINDNINGDWTLCGPLTTGQGSTTTLSMFLPNASTGLHNMALTALNTGDIGPMIFIDIVGASTSPTLCNLSGTFGFNNTGVFTYVVNTDYATSAASGISAFVGGVVNNTGTSQTSPANSLFDLNSFGGENENGPEPVDENNLGGGHLNTNTQDLGAVTFGVTSNADAIQGFSTNSVSFPSPNTTIYPSEVRQGAGAITGTSGTTISIQGLVSGTYTSGITATGSTGQTCILTTFNNGGSTNTLASVSLTGTNTIASGTALKVITSGINFTSAPTSATAVSGSATCSGTATISTTTGYKPYAAGDLFALQACGSATSGTITVSDGVNTYTAVDGPTTVAGVFCKTFYATNVSASAVTITATFATGTFRNIMLEECSGCTTLDAHSLASKTSSGVGLITGTATGTLASAHEVVFGFALCSNCVSVGSPGTVSTGACTEEGPDGLGNTSGYLVVGKTTSVSMTFIDQSASNGDSMATMSFH